VNLPDFEHLEPKTLNEACSLLHEYSDHAKVISGGTELLNFLRKGIIEPKFLINVKRLAELSELKYEKNSGLLIGSAVTLSEIIDSSLVQKKYPMLIEAANKVAAPALRNMATIGGNICLNTRCFFYNQSKFWRSSYQPCIKFGGSLCHVVKKGNRCFAVFQADAASALVALNAQIKLKENNKERIIPISEFYTGRGEVPNCLNPAEILVQIIIPPGNGQISSFQKLSHRKAFDFTQAGVALTIKFDKGKKIKDLRIVLNGVASRPLELAKVRDLLIGSKLDDNLIEHIAQLASKEVHPVNNTETSAAYRKRMIAVLVKRAFKKGSS
jgi:4-hydroxybenzoyl-CoA reductase subunit beta